MFALELAMFTPSVSGSTISMPLATSIAILSSLPLRRRLAAAPNISSCSAMLDMKSAALSARAASNFSRTTGGRAFSSAMATLVSK